jgi:predicted dehydrogenase
MADNRRDFLVQTLGTLAGLALVPEVGTVAFAAEGPPRKLAVIGVGRQGRAILTELLKIPPVEVSALCDTAGSRLQAALGRAKGAETFTDARALFDKRPDIDSVIVATPTHEHRALVEQALAAGKHVYCEAPLAATVEDCRAIAATAARSQSVFHAGFQGRSNPTYRRAQPLVGAELRDLVTMRAQYHRKTSWRFPVADGQSERAANWRLDPSVSTGLAGEVGAQQFDVAHWMRGSYPRRAEGSGAVRLHRDGRTVPDTITADLVWADGVRLRYEATLANSHGGQWEVFGGIHGTLRLAWTHGWLFKEPDAPTQGWEVYATRQRHFGEEGITLIANATQLAAQGRLKDGLGLEHPPLYYALADFVKSVTEGAPVACSAEEGARATIVGILLNQAITTGSPVELPAFD